MENRAKAEVRQKSKLTVMMICLEVWKKMREVRNRLSG